MTALLLALVVVDVVMFLVLVVLETLRARQRAEVARQAVLMRRRIKVLENTLRSGGHGG